MEGCRWRGGGVYSVIILWHYTSFAGIIVVIVSVLTLGEAGRGYRFIRAAGVQYDDEDSRVKSRNRGKAFETVLWHLEVLLEAHAYWVGFAHVDFWLSCRFRYRNLRATHRLHWLVEFWASDILQTDVQLVEDEP